MAISAVNIFYGKRKKNAYIICHLLAYKIKSFCNTFFFGQGKDSNGIGCAQAESTILEMCSFTQLTRIVE